MAEHGVLDLECRDRRAPGEGLKQPPGDAVDQVKEHRRMIRIGRPLSNWSFCALQASRLSGQRGELARSTRCSEPRMLG
jgi:hypothetical protein